MSHYRRSEWLRHLRAVFYKRNMMPMYLVYFVTSACTAKCPHCLLGERPDRRAYELTLDEIEKITQSLDRLLVIFLTGGEPFLRDDLPEIARLFHVNCGVQKFQIPSNGSLGERNVQIARRMARICPDAHVSVTISIDALGEKHDRIRGIPGLFERATNTFRELRKLEKEMPNYNTNLTVTVSAYNQDDLMELYDYLKNDLGAPNIFNTIVRGRPRCPEALDVDVEKFAAFSDAIDRDLLSGVTDGYGNFPLSAFLNAKNLISRRLISQIARERRYVIPCYAAQLSCVLYPEGQLYPCELLETPLGNLREVDYDVRKIWYCEQAEKIRRRIRREKCFCTYECFITSNILFNPRMTPRILAKWLEMEWRGRLCRRG